jgi:hypothetical protein
MLLKPLKISGTTFRDPAGREMMLRGVNLGGDCKVPYPYGGTHFPTDFSDHREVSFIGRPFPLNQADEHFARLQGWGFNVLRLLTSWEAIEHAGPGIYDHEYIAYYAELCRKAAEYGLYVFVDPHEDAWSRMTGGSGAPGWTFEAVGLDFTQFHAAGLSHVMQMKYDYSLGGRQSNYPQMTWGANHRLSPGGIMWTLFFTGKLFTPDFEIEGQNVQDYLQSHYIGAMKTLAQAVKDIPNVIGFDTLNEPVPGWIGKPLSYRHLRATQENPVNPRVGLALSPLDNLLSARGIPLSLPRILRDADTGEFSVGDNEILNADGVSIWLENHDCPFAAAGAYRVVDNKLIEVNELFFSEVKGRKVDIANDAYGPFFRAMASAVHEVNPEWLIFAELEPYSAYTGGPFPADMPAHSVNASHWYDSSTLYTKKFSPDSAFDFTTGTMLYGRDAIKASYVKQMSDVAHLAECFSPNGAPTLIGEFGIPFDLDEGAAFKAWAKGKRGEEVWDMHTQALTLMYEAMDQLKIHATLWNYTASNENNLAIGDGWNQEDLSIFSRDQIDLEHGLNGGRGELGFCRPYVRYAQGDIIDFTYDFSEKVFVTALVVNHNIAAETEMFLPKIHFGDNPELSFDGVPAVARYNDKTQSVSINGLSSGRLKITVRRQKQTN